MNPTRQPIVTTKPASEPVDSLLRQGTFLRLVAANVSFFMAFTTYFLLPKFMVTQLDASEAEIGWAMASFGVLAILLLPSVGNLSDRFGRRPFMLIGAVIMGVTSIGFLWVNEVGWLLFLLRALHGAAFAFWFVNSATMVVDLVPRQRRGGALGLFGVSTLVTHGVSPSVAEWLSMSLSFDVVFMSALAYAVLAGVLAARLPDARSRLGEADSRLRRSMVTLIADPAIGPILCAAVLLGVGFSTVLVYSQPLALLRGIEPVSALLIAYSLISIMIRIFFSTVPDRPNKRVVVVPSMLSMASGVALLYWLDSMTVFLIAGLLMGAGHSLSYPTMNALLINRLRNGEHGRGMSLFVGGFNLGMILAQVIFGYLSAVVGLATIFLLGAAAVIAAVPVFLAATTTRLQALHDETPQD